MAAPESKTLHTLDGNWALNKKLSDSLDEVLSLQGLSYLSRAAIKLASPSYTIRQSLIAADDPDSDDSDTVTRLEADQILSGVTGSTDVRILDDRVLHEKTLFWGRTTIQHGRADAKDLENEFLTDNWLFDGEDSSLMVTYTESQDSGWKGTQAAGFRLINGERRYCVRVLVKKGKKSATAQLVYDYND